MTEVLPWVSFCFDFLLSIVLDDDFGHRGAGRGLPLRRADGIR